MVEDEKTKKDTEVPLTELYDTLLIWDGISTATKDSENKVEHKLQWEGKLVACTDSPDAMKVEAPIQGAFEKMVSSELQYEVSGMTKHTSPEGLFCAELTGGLGYDPVSEASKKHKDDMQYLYLAHLCWKGNVNNTSQNAPPLPTWMISITMPSLPNQCMTNSLSNRRRFH
eukprot:14577781-Ditylum_brightwellii.AAC.1